MKKEETSMLTNRIGSNTNQLRYDNTREQMNQINMKDSSSSTDSFMRRFGLDDKKTKPDNAEKSININIINESAINGTQNRKFSSSNVSNDKRCIRNEEQNSSNNNNDLVNLMTESNMQNSINAKLNNGPTFFINGMSIKQKEAEREINMKDHEKTIENALKLKSIRPIENERQNNVENSFSFSENNNSIKIPIEKKIQNNVKKSFSFGEDNISSEIPIENEALDNAEVSNDEKYIRNEEQNSSHNNTDLVNFMMKSNAQNRPIENERQNNTNKKLRPVSHRKNEKLQSRTVLSEIVNDKRNGTNRHIKRKNISSSMIDQQVKQIKQNLLDVKNKRNERQNNTNQKPSPVSRRKNEKLQNRTVLSEIVNGNKQITQKNRNGTHGHIKKNINSSMIDQQVKQTKRDPLDIKNKRNKGQNNTNKKLSPVSHRKNEKLQNRTVLSEIVNGNKQITQRNYNDIYQHIKRKTNLEMDKQAKQDLLDVKNKRKQKVKSNYYIPAKGQYEETKKILNKVKNNNTYRRYCSNGIK